MEWLAPIATVGNIRCGVGAICACAVVCRCYVLAFMTSCLLMDAVHWVFENGFKHNQQERAPTQDHALAPRNGGVWSVCAQTGQ